jgi:ubiquinone/menaquinone biosynthesis C-methylase UbiE
MPGPVRESSEDDAVFLHQLDLFTSCSTEKGIELVVLGELIAKLPRRKAFLDIGAGEGALTVPVSQMFESTTVVEPNPLMAARFHKRYPEFRVFGCRWESVDLSEERFDLVLCSHVLYYIPEGTWESVIRKMYSFLAPGGCLAIVLQSPLGQVATFFNHFATYDVPILELTGRLIEDYGEDSVRLRYFQNQIRTDTLEDMVEIGLFLLIDPAFREKRDQIAEYFGEHSRMGNGYALDQDEILLSVWKGEETGEKAPDSHAPIFTSISSRLG